VPSLNVTLFYISDISEINFVIIVTVIVIIIITTISTELDVGAARVIMDNLPYYADIRIHASCLSG
jgi:hypothetical protein